MDDESGDGDQSCNVTADNDDDGDNFYIHCVSKNGTLFVFAIT